MLAAAGRVAHLPQGLGLYLNDVFAGHVEHAAHLFERPGVAVAETEAQAQHLLFAFGERAEDFVEALGNTVKAVALAGDSADLSSVKSPKLLSPSSPTGVSRLMASWAILRMLRTLSADICISSAISSALGSRPYSWTRARSCVRAC